MLNKNTVIVDLNEYLDLVRKAEKLEAILDNTFSVKKSWRDRPQIVVDVALHEERFRQLLEESEFADGFYMPDNSKETYWTHVIDVFREVPVPEEDEQNIGIEEIEDDVDIKMVKKEEEEF